MESNQNLTADPVLSDREEVNLNSALLESYISSLEEQKWQRVQDRMVDPMSQTEMAQVSGRIIQVVSQLVLQLFDPAVKAQLRRDDQSRVSDSDSRSYSDTSSPSAVTPVDLQKYYEITKETLVQSLGSSASQPSVSSMLGDLAKQLNQGLCVLAAESQDSTGADGSEVKSAAMKALALAGETLAGVTDKTVAQDVDALLETVTEEVMSAVADSMRSCQGKERKSARILRILASKITKRCSESAELQPRPQQLSPHSVGLKSNRDDQPETSIQSKTDVHGKPYLLRVSPEEVSSDLLEFHGSCLQVLKGLLAKLLALFSPWSFSLMTSPHRSGLPSLESVASDILYIIVNGVKKICQKKKSKKLRQRKKAKVTETKVNSTAAEVKVALQEKLREFLTCHREAVEEGKKDKIQKAKMTLSNQRDETAECEDSVKVQIITSAVRTLLHQVHISSSDRRRSTLTKLEDLISDDKLSSFSQLLTSSLSPLPSGATSAAEQVRLFCEAAVKHLLRLFFLPPISWGMGLVLRVQTSKSSADRFRESAQLYDDIISQYAQLMSNQVMSSISRSLEGDNSAPQQKKKRKNIIHFFQKLPGKILNKWRTLTNRKDVFSSPSVDGATAVSEDEEGGGDSSEPGRGDNNFFQSLPDRIVKALFVYEPRPWQTQALFPI
ncbi:uncharacterized protein [Trachinotus anak]|uniref:uncharacterized protein n=1 Tax=Trachinotus anak TaxID=443729 RepID=UPI0039F178C0